jgi:hypothetical protein
VEFRASEERLPPFLRRRANAMAEYLLNQFDQTLTVIPGDRWTTGQKVFHVAEMRQLERAQRIARECRSDVWWCAGLVGFTSYMLDQFPRADSAFAVWLETQSAEERCRVEDVADLLYEDTDRRWYLQLPCAERERVNRIAWWLSDPLYLTPGNERLSAHHFRLVYRRLLLDREAPEPRNMWNLGASNSILLSLGIPAYIAKSEAVVIGRHFEQDILLQYHQPTYHFIPRIAAARDPLRATEDMWDLHDSNAVERYHPRFGLMAPLRHQVAWFRREGAASVVAAFDLEGTGLLKDAARQLGTSAVVLSSGPEDIRVLRGLVPGTDAVHRVLAPAESVIVSLEALVAGVGAARARFAAGPPKMPAQRVAMSDFLLLRPVAGELPNTLERVTPHARTTTDVERDAPVGMYWEVYGLVAGDSATYRLTAVETGRSLGVNLGRVLGVVRSAASSIVEWTEVARADEQLSPHTLTLDLSALNLGPYLVTLEVRVPGQLPVSVTRRVNMTR